MRLLSILAIVAVFSGTTAGAIEPERREVIVTHNRVWDGFAYHENFVPSDHEEMLLLSGKDNAVTFVRTQEYYWPLARQKYVAFDTQREEIVGTLRISQDEKIVEELEAAPYVVLYPEGAVNGNAELIWGGAAAQAHRDYRQEERDFIREFAKSQREQSRYNEALKQAGIARLAGKGVQEVIAPPSPSEPGLKLVTEPRVAFRVALVAGKYQAEIIQNGSVIPGTQKSIRVIESTAREVLIAEVIPEERWTRPIPANTRADKIYTTPGTQFYITLAHASGFNEADYIGLIRPQGVSVGGRNIWVRRRAADHEKLQLRWDTTAVAQIKLRSPIKVDQTQGAEFGYVVRPAEEDERPDIQAFTITVPEAGNVRRGSLFISEDGYVFNREIIVVQPGNNLLTWLLAAGPVLFGMGLLWRRRLMTRILA